jgi:hypothetical protein
VRWTPHRKAALCESILRGAISLGAACSLHAISEAELRGWLDRFRSAGKAGLYLTKPSRIVH